MPYYRVMPDGAIRVMHLDLDRSWWNRATSKWEQDVAEVEDVIREATGLQRVHKTHHFTYVEMRVRKSLVAQATVAVMMQFGQQNESSLLGHNAKAVGLDAAGGQSHTSDGLCPGAGNGERT